MVAVVDFDFDNCALVVARDVYVGGLGQWLSMDEKTIVSLLVKQHNVWSDESANDISIVKHDGEQAS